MDQAWKSHDPLQQLGLKVLDMCSNILSVLSYQIKPGRGNSLAVQWLGLGASLPRARV